MRSGPGIRFPRSIWDDSHEPTGPPATLLVSYGFVSATKIWSSIGTERVNSVGMAALETPTAWAEPDRAGPAGLPPRGLLSPGSSEMRDVFGVHEVAPVQVSRTKICR